MNAREISTWLVRGLTGTWEDNETWGEFTNRKISSAELAMRVLDTHPDQTLAHDAKIYLQMDINDWRWDIDYDKNQTK